MIFLSFRKSRQALIAFIADRQDGPYSAAKPGTTPACDLHQLSRTFMSRSSHLTNSRLSPAPASLMLARAALIFAGTSSSIATAMMEAASDLSKSLARIS